jgi:hypothetical protein
LPSEPLHRPDCRHSGGGLLTAAFLQAAVAAADTTGTAAEISDYAFTIDGTTFDPGSDGYNEFGPLAPLAPLLEIGAGSTGIALSPNATQPLEVYVDGSDVGTAHTSTTAADILGIDSAQFTVQSITPPVADVAAALTNSDLDFSGAGINVSDLATALTEASGFAALPFGSGDITGGNVSFALFGSGITLPPSITGADIAGVLNGLDTSDLPDVGAMYSITDLGSGWANVYVAVPNADGTEAATITDTLVTPFGNFDIPTDYDAVAHLDPGAAFDGFGATTDNSDISDISDNAFTLDGLTFDPGSDGFASLSPLFSVAPLLDLAGGQLAVAGAEPSPFAIEPLQVYNDGSDIGTVVTSENVQNLLGIIDATQLTVEGYHLPESDVVDALTNSDIDFASLGTTATEVANALGTIGTLNGAPSAGSVFGDLNDAGISVTFPQATDIANVLDSAVTAYTPAAELPDLGTVYSVANLGHGWANVYIATPNADGTEAASITDTLVTPFGNIDIPTSYDAIAPIDAGEPFAGLHVTSDASGLSDNAFTIDDTTFDPGSDGFISVDPLSGNAPLLEIGGGFPFPGVSAFTQDLDVYSSGSELGSIEAAVTAANLFGLIDVTELDVSGYNVPTSDLVSALDNSDISFAGADFDASDLVNALENVDQAAFNLGGGDLTGQDITTYSGFILSAAGIDPEDVANVINGAVTAYGADLPDLGTVYSVTDFGGGFENVYVAIPNADGTEAASITDYLVTPFGNVDLSTMFDAVALLDPGDAAAGVSTAADATAGGAFDLFDPSSWF